MSQPFRMTDAPPTPQLDAAHKVQQITDLIGTFVAEWLPRQGYLVAQWQWMRYPCPKEWTRRNGELIEAGILVPEAKIEAIDPYACPCRARGDQPGQHMKRELHQVGVTDAWMHEQLARFIGLDPDAMEAEKRALLAYIREKLERPAHDGP